MVDLGRRSPGGDRPNLRWLHAAAEEAELRPPYALVTAGASLHWLDWEIVLPRFRQALTPNGSLAVVGLETSPVPWADDLQRLIDRYSTNRHYRPYDLVAELVARDLFRPERERRTAPVAFSQPVAGYVESFHARNGFSRERMGAARAAAFDAAVSGLVAGHCPFGRVDFSIVGIVVSGRPGRN